MGTVNATHSRQGDMFNQILQEIQEKVRSREYVLTLHAEDEMVQDGLTSFDVENALLTGKIVRRQKDLQRDGRMEICRRRSNTRFRNRCRRNKVNFQ